MISYQKFNIDKLRCPLCGSLYSFYRSSISDDKRYLFMSYRCFCCSVIAFLRYLRIPLSRFCPVDLSVCDIDSGELIAFTSFDFDGRDGGLFKV